MSIFSNFFKSSGSSSDIAKNRLKVAITSDRAVCSPELMDQMKNDIRSWVRDSQCIVG